LILSAFISYFGIEVKLYFENSVRIDQLMYVPNSPFTFTSFTNYVPL